MHAVSFSIFGVMSSTLSDLFLFIVTLLLATMSGVMIDSCNISDLGPSNFESAMGIEL